MSDHDDLLLPHDLVAVEELIRELDPDDRRLDLTPGHLSDAIATELGVELAATGAAPPDAAADVADNPSVASETRSADVVDLADRRRRTRFVSVAAAAVTVVVAGIVAVTVGGDDEPVVVASAELEYDEGAFDELGATSAATVIVVDADGGYRVGFEESALAAPEGEDADLEMWLIAVDDDGAIVDLVSVGVVDPDDPGLHDVPDGYDPAVYSVVDISVEPHDGDETHSGRSILRAPLDFA